MDFSLYYSPDIKAKTKTMIQGIDGAHKTSLGIHWIIAKRMQWDSCQIPKIVGCACAGNAGDVFPTTTG